ncbi:hypothetical protein SRHO_G00094550 [Serrasalmus rhombeus]
MPKRKVDSENRAFQTRWEAEYLFTDIAGFIVVKEVAQAARPVTEGEFLKSCVIKVCDLVCPDKKQILANLSQSRNTAADRVCEMATDFRTQLSERSKDFTADSLAVDESPDMTDAAQLAIFIRGVDSNLRVPEEILDIKSMHGTTGEDMFENVCQSVTDMKPLDKLIGLMEQRLCAVKEVDQCGDASEDAGGDLHW